jgi:excisionase family DNA binding protein
MDGQPHHVNINQACAIAGVCRRTMYKWIDDNKVEYVRTAGGQRRILVASLFRDGNVLIDKVLTPR